MSNGRGKHKSRGRRRTKKTSRGIGGAARTRLSETAKVLLGKGQVDSLEPTEMKSPWRGVPSVREPYDKAQALLNRSLYPHLFEEDRR